MLKIQSLQQKQFTKRFMHKHIYLKMLDEEKTG